MPSSPERTGSPLTYPIPVWVAPSVSIPILRRWLFVSGSLCQSNTLNLPADRLTPPTGTLRDRYSWKKSAGPSCLWLCFCFGPTTITAVQDWPYRWLSSPAHPPWSWGVPCEWSLYPETFGLMIPSVRNCRHLLTIDCAFTCSQSTPSGTGWSTGSTTV